VNLGNPIETTVGELASMIIDIAGSQSKVVYCRLPVDDPRRRKPSIARAQALLDWSPRVELAGGLQQTITYFEKNLGMACGPGAGVRCSPTQDEDACRESLARNAAD
jgi:UDP-glucuronate decarboxylase